MAYRGKSATGTLTYLVLGERDRLPFGKYRGRTVRDIMNNDPQYLWWVIENMIDFRIADELHDEIERDALELNETFWD